MFVNITKHNCLLYSCLKKVIQLQMYIPLFIENNTLKLYSHNIYKFLIRKNVITCK